MRLRAVLLALSLLAAPLAAPETARAQPISGLYVGGGAGYDLQQSIRIDPSVPGVGGSSLSLARSNGLAALGSIGYGFGSGWRIEAEGDFLRNGIRSPQITISRDRARPAGSDRLRRHPADRLGECDPLWLHGERAL